MNILRKSLTVAKNGFKKGFEKVNAVAYSVLLGIAGALSTVAGFADPQLAGGGDIGTAMSNLIDYILTIVLWLGVGVAIYGCVVFGLSLIDTDRADQKTKGIMFIVAGAVLVGIKPLLTVIGITF